MGHHPKVRLILALHNKCNRISAPACSMLAKLMMPVFPLILCFLLHISL